MEYDSQTYFTENEQDDVKGFTILKATDDEYHIGEKWLKEDGEGTWVQYWVQAAQLNTRVKDGACEPVGSLSDEQFAQVCERVGFYVEESAEAIA